MSRIVLGVGASHTTLMNTRWHEVAHLDRARRFRDALRDARERLAGQSPDLAVIVGSNHFRGAGLDLMPAFTVCVGDLICAGEHGTPEGSQPTDPAAALRLCELLVEHGIDVAFSTELTVDHGISHAIQFLVPEGSPVVAVVINVFAPPLPTLARTCEFGSALGAAARALPDDRRVAVIGTGGLSHTLPFPDWSDPRTDDDRFLVESWRRGRTDWSLNEPRRRRIILGSPAIINSRFDRSFLARLVAGEHHEFVQGLDNRELVAAAGNGGNEIRAWLAMRAAMGSATGDALYYSAMPEWLTGMAVAVFTPTGSGSSGHRSASRLLIDRPRHSVESTGGQS